MLCAATPQTDIAAQRPHQGRNDGTSSPTQGDICSPKRYGCHACTLPSTQSTWETPLSQPPKGVGFPDPLSGTLNKVDGEVSGGIAHDSTAVIAFRPTRYR